MSDSMNIPDSMRKVAVYQKIEYTFTVRCIEKQADMPLADSI